MWFCYNLICSDIYEAGSSLRHSSVDCCQGESICGGGVTTMGRNVAGNPCNYYALISTKQNTQHGHKSFIVDPTY